jgi:hypothetical protein
VNLNRVYDNCKPDLYPTIYAAKQAIIHEQTCGKLFMFTDFHAHATKRGCFVFGNGIKSESVE